MLLQRVEAVSGHLLSRNEYIVNDHDDELLSHRDKLIHRLHALVENCLFADEKHLEDLSVVTVLSESLSDDTIQEMMNNNNSTEIIAILPQWMRQHLSNEEKNLDNHGQSDNNQDQSKKSGSKKRKTADSSLASTAGAMTLKGLQTIISSASGSAIDENVSDSLVLAIDKTAGPKYKGINDCKLCMKVC